MNHDQATELDRDEAASSWRSIGAVAAGWAARIEAERHAVSFEDEHHFVPVAWAAE